MNSKAKIISAVIGIVGIIIALVFGLKNPLGGSNLIPSRGDSTSVVVHQSVSENSFAIVDFGKLKIHLIDSLKRTLKPELIAVYEANNYNLDSLISEAKKEALAQFKDSLNKPVFSSRVDSNFVVKDSSGRVRDSIQVFAYFHSPIPLHKFSQHTISMHVKSFGYDSTKTIMPKSFWSNIKPGLMAAYGYGLKAKMWDWFIGAGANFDIEGIIKNILE